MASRPPVFEGFEGSDVPATAAFEVEPSTTAAKWGVET